MFNDDTLSKFHQLSANNTKQLFLALTASSIYQRFLLSNQSCYSLSVMI